MLRLQSFAMHSQKNDLFSEVYSLASLGVTTFYHHRNSYWLFFHLTGKLFRLITMNPSNRSLKRDPDQTETDHTG